MKLYALFDKKMASYGPVMMGHNDGHMSRTLHESLSRTEATPAKYPEDYDLYELGEYEAESTGVIRSELRFVCNLNVVFHPNGSGDA